MIVVLMGPPGAGKGTQAKRLAERYSMVHLSSGDILRAEKASGSPLAGELAKYMNAGELVPDEVVVRVMAKALTGGAKDGAVLLDGFPRTVPQAQTLDEQLVETDDAIDAVVVVTADEDLIIERITGRRSCPECGKAYHVKFMRPHKAGVCDTCGAELTQRDDDSEDVVRQRLSAYKRQTEPVVEYYRNRPGLGVWEVDGTRPADEVTASLTEVLSALKAGC